MCVTPSHNEQYWLWPVRYFRDYTIWLLRLRQKTHEISSLYHLLLEKPFNMSHGCWSIPVWGPLSEGLRPLTNNQHQLSSPDIWANFVVDLPDCVHSSEDYSLDECLRNRPNPFQELPNQVLQILKSYKDLNITINIYYVMF